MFYPYLTEIDHSDISFLSDRARSKKRSFSSFISLYTVVINRLVYTIENTKIFKKKMRKKGKNCKKNDAKRHM